MPTPVKLKTYPITKVKKKLPIPKFDYSVSWRFYGELKVYGKCWGCQTIPTVRMYIAHWGIFFAKKTFQITIQT